MDRRNNMKAFERGVRALRDEGISVKVDLIIGLPGDTCDSVRRSLHYLNGSNLFDEAQVFNLAVLPGTAFRQEAPALGLEYQARPPYYVHKTPTLELADLYGLMDEAEELFDTEFDPLPPPKFDFGSDDTTAIDCLIYHSWRVDLDQRAAAVRLPTPELRAQAFSLWLQADDFRLHQSSAGDLVSRILDDNPHTTLQVVLEPGDATTINPAFLAELRRTCYRRTTYLDRFYSILPGPMKGSKRLVVLLDDAAPRLSESDIDALEEFATVVSYGRAHSTDARQGAFVV
jgi:hypothetical protein